jgi:predicted enzyme related to lactoylglutathione lyase
MIQKLSHTSIYVLDQDSAKRFYTEVLGFEVRNDVSMGGFRWLTVSPKGQPEIEMVLMPATQGPMMDEARAKTLRGLIEAGAFGCGVLETDDCQATYEDLKKKGVVFRTPPTQRPYGVEAVMKDDSGNWFSLTQRPR